MRTVLVSGCGVSGRVDGNPALVSVMPVVSMVDDRREFGRNAVIQVSVSTARVDGYSVVGRWRTRVRVEIQRLLIKRTGGSQRSTFWVISSLGSWHLGKRVRSLGLIQSFSRGSLLGAWRLRNRPRS
jgi:hypothetical protein